MGRVLGIIDRCIATQLIKNVGGRTSEWSGRGQPRPIEFRLRSARREPSGQGVSHDALLPAAVLNLSCRCRADAVNHACDATIESKVHTSGTAKMQRVAPTDQSDECPEVTVVIEIPRGSFLKRGSTGHVDFVSPLPCPFNYGSVETHIGLEGDLLDAVVLGRRLPRGTRVTVRAYGAVGLTDRGMHDDKLICSHRPIGEWKKALVLGFFRFYALSKHLLNLIRGRPGRNACEGWSSSSEAIARALPRVEQDWKGPSVPF